MVMTLNERLPFVGLALIAFTLPSLGKELALILTFLMIIWFGLGGGVTATAWQSLIAKVIPGNRLGTFFGLQAGLANLGIGLGSLGAGFLLQSVSDYQNFGWCFVIASVGMLGSYIALGQTREPLGPPVTSNTNQPALSHQIRRIIKGDENFRWFIVARMASQLATVAFAFYTVYALRRFEMNSGTAGLLTGVFAGVQIIANPIIGWIGDKVSHRLAQLIGAGAALVSALVAWQAPSLEWFYLVFVLAGIANVTIWTASVAMTLELSPASQRSVYIGLANTMIAPITILSPLAGGWLADSAGYSATFLLSAGAGLVTLIVFGLFVREPRHRTRAT
jgi:MFS family permease